MVGANAGWIIATMTNEKAVRHRAKVKLPRETVGALRASLFIYPELPIPIWEWLPCPQPTAFADRHLLPETLLRRTLPR
jgi:hypothetical protein